MYYTVSMVRRYIRFKADMNSTSATQQTTSHSRSFQLSLLHLPDYAAILISVRRFSRISGPKAEMRMLAKVKAPLRCLSGLLALLSASEKPQHLDGLPEEVVPT